MGVTKKAIMDRYHELNKAWPIVTRRWVIDPQSGTTWCRHRWEDVLGGMGVGYLCDAHREESKAREGREHALRQRSA